MNPVTPAANEPETQSFAETALRMGGKSEEESKRMGAVDKADEQVDLLFRHKTDASPIHKAIWDGVVPLKLFQAPLPTSAPCDVVMEKALALIKRRRDQGTLLNQDKKLSNETIDELAEAGYWGLLIDPKYGGSGAPFVRFAPFLSKMALYDPMTSAMASVHGCIGAVDPLRSFGSDEQKERLLPILASQRIISSVL